jgi:RNA recognition motif-containing protein
MTEERGRSLTPPRYRDRSRSPPRSSASAENSGSNLFVTGLVPKVQEEELETLFSKYGQVFLSY